MSIPKMPKWAKWVLIGFISLLAVKFTMRLADLALSELYPPERSALLYQKSSDLSKVSSAKEVYAYYDVNTTTYSLVLTSAESPLRLVIPDISNRVFSTLMTSQPPLASKIKHFTTADIPVEALRALHAQSPRIEAPDYPGAPLVRGVERTTDAVFAFVGTHFFQIMGLVVMLLLLKLMVQPAMEKNSEAVILPDDLKGSFKDIIGFLDIVRELREVCDMIKNPEEFIRHGVGDAANILLTGPAGVGKTKMAGYFAKELKAPLISVAGSNLESGLVGGGSRRLKAIAEKAAKLAADFGYCVVFIDEGQTLFQQRGKGGPLSSKHQDDTPNTLLSLLDGVKVNQTGQVIWMVASNFDDQSMPMDEAVLRRFPHKINFRLPNKAEREQMLQAFLARSNSSETSGLRKGSPTLEVVAKLTKNPTSTDSVSPLVDPTQLNLGYVAAVTEGLAPAHLETIIKQAKLAAIRDKLPITTDSLMRSFERATIGLTDRETTAELQQTRQTVAYHELGHFMMELDAAARETSSLPALFDKLHTLKISTESVSKLGALGYVLSRQSEDKLQRRDQLEHRIKRLYGGVACEEVKYGANAVSTGAFDDIQKATNLIVHMTQELNMYSHVKLNAVVADKAGVKIPTQTDPSDMASRLYKETLDSIRFWMPLIDELAPVLLADYVLTKDQIVEILSKSSTFEQLLSQIKH